MFELKDYKMPEIDKTRADQTLVNAIMEAVGECDIKYSGWLSRIHRSRKSMNYILDLVDKAKNMEEKYRIGYIINRL